MAVVVTVAKGYNLGYVWKNQAHKEGPEQTIGGYYINAAQAGDTEAIAAITRAGEMLGRGIAILCDVLNPELIVCGTLARYLGDLYLDPARRMLAAEALDPCPIVPAELGDDLPERSALAIVVK